LFDFFWVQWKESQLVKAQMRNNVVKTSEHRGSMFKKLFGHGHGVLNKKQAWTFRKHMAV